MARKWTRQHEQQRQRIMEMLHRDARPFADLSDEAKATRRGLPFLDWCRTYLPHYFTCQPAQFHRDLVAQLNEPAMPTSIGMFRGAGKSVLCSLADPLYRTLGRLRRYFLYGSQVQGLAVDLMDFVRVELEHNPRVRCDYGEIRVDGPEDAYVVEFAGDRHTVKLEAFGIGMSPRGRRHGAHRPDAYIGDDLEDAILARSPKREQQLWDWHQDEVIPAMEPDTWTFTVVGTMFGPGCQLERAKEAAAKADSSGRPLHKVMFQPATDAQGHSVWPQRFPDEALDRVRAMIGVRNWNRNYALVADDPTKPFQPQWFTTYRPADIDTSHLDVVAWLDPAVSERETSCPRAMVVIGGDRKTGDRYVLDARISHASPMVMVQWLFDAHEAWNPRVIGIESNGGYALIEPLVHVREDETGVRLPVRLIAATLPKALRIEGLAVFVERGLWHFPSEPSPGVRTLLEQFVSYPDGWVDGPDACAGADSLIPRRATGRNEFAYRSLGRRASLVGV